MMKRKARRSGGVPSALYGLLRDGKIFGTCLRCNQPVSRAQGLALILELIAEHDCGVVEWRSDIEWATHPSQHN